MGLKKGQKVQVNGEIVEPINKVKLWELPGWTGGRIRRLIEAKQKEQKDIYEERAKLTETE
jgi:hypothetical protein